MSGDKQLHEPTTDELFKWDDLKKVSFTILPVMPY
jgi:hypothetical protein